MLFNSLAFLLFIAVVLPAYYVLPHRAQNYFLLGASLFFYASWDWRFLAPLLTSTVIDYFCALQMQKLSERPGPNAARKRWLALSIVTNLGLLSFFKYFNFFETSLQRLISHFGITVHPATLHLLLPLGISFYTFQALSYTIDVYRKDFPAKRSFPDFLLSVMFFPHLVAGPIQRSASLLPQIENARRITADKVAQGIHLIVWGYFKKVFIADRVAPIVDTIFSSHPNGSQTVLGVYAFAVQIFCDFSGYTDIARGLAKLMGFELMLNFNIPYFATSPRDFWNRWHISLSTWFRDYLYIPLGGNRLGSRRTQINLMITMAVAGLWHGANVTFLYWGVYHGFLLIAQRAFNPLLGRISFRTLPARTLWFSLRVLVVFQLICYGWLLFRAPNTSTIVEMTRTLLHRWGTFDHATLKYLVWIVSPLAAVETARFCAAKLQIPVFTRVPVELRVSAYSVLVYMILFLGGQPRSFIYFQF
jgi:D-alanyl-lipoteichoic acid acyltransferase DltB (MBOAT superfamily)